MRQNLSEFCKSVLGIDIVKQTHVSGDSGIIGGIIITIVTSARILVLLEKLRKEQIANSKGRHERTLYFNLFTSGIARKVLMMRHGANKSFMLYSGLE